MLKKLLVVLIFISLGSTSAQTFVPGITSLNRDHDGITFQGDTVRILGVMVNFQEDKDAATFGNGKFGSIYSRDYGNTILDPLPHDKAYFDSHLEFVKNYFSKVSGNKIHIEYYIFPDTFSVSKAMRNYSPVANSNDFAPLGDFAAEVWRMADSLNPRFDFSHFHLFSIFHAGVGRDITLPGSLGNERDLPSVYLGLKTLKTIYGNEFEGFELPNNNFRISNSMIVPETESRELSSFGSTFLFEITINGLIAANVASFLGLPDLFDTNTGLSAIGRFGLMDGQSIFAYNGVFPPEPSAWEKLRMNWAEAVELEPGDYDINLVTKIAASLSDTVILKVPINSSEYFLVENRIRDAGGDGSILTYILDGEVRTRTFFKDTTGFYSFSVDSVDGVVIDVDEFDWALPGNGIVIWHIDENVIQEKLSDNKINTDKFNRGVDVEEADGIQDIGERFITIFGDEIIGEGTEDDLWYAGNPSTLYKNRFAKDTRPDTRSSKGGNSLIVMDSFSEISNRMSLRISFGDSIIKPIFISQLDITSANNKLTVTDSSGRSNFAVLSDSNLTLINESGTVTASVNNASIFKPAGFTFGGSEYLIGVGRSSFNIYRNGVLLLSSIDVGGTITAPPVIRKKPTEEYDLLIGTREGKIYLFSLNSLPSGLSVLLDSINLLADYSVIEMASDGIYISAVAINNDPGAGDKYVLFDSDNGRQTIKASGFKDYALTKDKQGNNISILLFENNSFMVYSNGILKSEFTSPGEQSINSFAVADIKQDGENYILYASGKLYAVNLTGVLADNFPYEDPSGYGFEGIPLAADFEGDTRSEIISFTGDGRIFAFDGGSGRLVAGFPLSGGSKVTASALFNYRGLISLAVLTDERDFYTWVLGSTPGTYYWSEENADNMNTAFAEAASNEGFISEFFPVNRTYNYPNPVYDGRTFIRYYVSENSKINIKIFDLAGDFVAELNDDAAGGVDNETMWDVNNIQSGVYLARVEASSLNGRSESTIIKIAVIK